jgi:KDO2-lipid IV(A) lauroyltransferase
VKWLLGLLASLPTPIMHAIAVPAGFLLYRVFRYRRATVRNNLLHAFPNLSETERREIERDSYRHLANLFLEILRSTRMSQAEFARRVTIRNLQMFYDATHDLQKQAIVLLIHQGNWEWMLHGVMAQLPISVDPVYKELHSEFWDQYMLESRSRFGAQPMPLLRVGRTMIRGRAHKRIIGMVADQSGPRSGGYWTEVLGRPASFNRGAEKLARTLDLPVLFAQCRQTRTGYYEIEFHELSLSPKTENGDDILERFVRKAEQVITEQPCTYLWTNRRWKKKPP